MDGAILGIERSFPFIKHCYSVKLLESLPPAAQDHVWFFPYYEPMSSMFPYR